MNIVNIDSNKVKPFTVDPLQRKVDEFISLNILILKIGYRIFLKARGYRRLLSWLRSIGLSANIETRGNASDITIEYWRYRGILDTLGHCFTDLNSGYISACVVSLLNANLHPRELTFCWEYCRTRIEIEATLLHYYEEVLEIIPKKFEHSPEHQGTLQNFSLEK